MANDSDVELDAMFKRKRRNKGTGRKRKRLRHKSEDLKESSDNEHKVAVSTTSATEKKNDTNDASHNTSFELNATEIVSKHATAERLDVGGDGGGDKKGGKGFYAPMGAPSHLRVSVRFDYQPDVCKDFKETGFCGFGDACKFLHDRSDYKAGWQLEKEWSEKQRLRQERIARGEDPDDDAADASKSGTGDLDADGLPFACHICRKSFTSPVETLCKHYFCEDCILKRMETDSHCPVCNGQLRGTLNVAHKLIARIAANAKS